VGVDCRRRKGCSIASHVDVVCVAEWARTALDMWAGSLSIVWAWTFPAACGACAESVGVEFAPRMGGECVQSLGGDCTVKVGAGFFYIVGSESAQVFGRDSVHRLGGNCLHRVFIDCSHLVKVDSDHQVRGQSAHRARGDCVHLVGGNCDHRMGGNIHTLLRRMCPSGGLWGNAYRVSSKCPLRAGGVFSHRIDVNCLDWVDWLCAHRVGWEYAHDLRGDE
jgi:hypothetical protein